MPAFTPKSDRQSDSNNLRQLGLRLTSQHSVDVGLEAVTRQPTFNAAIVLCVQTPGLHRKQVYKALGIDAATWSRIDAGSFIDLLAMEPRALDAEHDGGVEGGLAGHCL